MSFEEWLKETGMFNYRKEMIWRYGLNTHEEFKSSHPLEEGILLLSLVLETSVKAIKWMDRKAACDLT